MVFSITFVVKEADPKWKSDYLFQFIESLEMLRVNVARDDVLQNWCNFNNVTMNGDIPWWRPRKKSHEFMQMIVEAFTELGAVIIDCTTVISDFMYPCLYPWMT